MHTALLQRLSRFRFSPLFHVQTSLCTDLFASNIQLFLRFFKSPDRIFSHQNAVRILSGKIISVKLTVKLHNFLLHIQIRKSFRMNGFRHVHDEKNLLQTHVPVKYAARRQIDLIGLSPPRSLHTSYFHKRHPCFLYGLPIVHTAVIDKDIIRIPGSQLLKIDLCMISCIQFAVTLRPPAASITSLRSEYFP